MDVPEDLMLKYLERRKRDLEKCITYFEENNFSEIEKIGHQLKGNGKTFGHPELSLIGKQLETAAAHESTSEIELAIKELSVWVHKISN